jgi:hypothetical protein
MTEDRKTIIIMEGGAPIHKSLVAKKWRKNNEINVLY